MPTIEFTAIKWIIIKIISIIINDFIANFNMKIHRAYYLCQRFKKFLMSFWKHLKNILDQQTILPLG